MSNITSICFSLVPAVYHGIQLVRESGGLLAPPLIDNDSYSSGKTESEKKAEKILKKLFPKSEKILVSEARQQLSASVIKYSDSSIKAIVPIPFSNDPEMLHFILHEEVSAILNKDITTYRLANTINSFGVGLILGYSLPVYAAVPLVSCWSSRFAILIRNKQEAKANQDTLKRCKVGQIRGGLRYFNLMTAIFRVSMIIESPDPSIKNLDKLIEGQIEPPPKGAYLLNSLKIKILRQALSTKGSEVNLSDKEISLLVVMGLEYFQSLSSSSIEDTKLKLLSTLLSYDLLKSNVSEISLDDSRNI